MILRIDNEHQLLSVEPKDFAKARGSARRQGKKRRRIQNQPNPDEDDSLDLKKPESTPPPSRTKSIRLKRDDVESALVDINGLMERLRIAPYKRNDQPSGFRISGIPRDSVLRKFGLRSRDIIKEVNGQVMTSPAQAEDFFRTLSEGGELEIKLKRRRRDRWIHLDIE